MRYLQLARDSHRSIFRHAEGRRNDIFAGRERPLPDQWVSGNGGEEGYYD